MHIQSPPSVPPDEPLTLLVVEDDEAIRTLMVRILTEEGYRLLSAADGAAGLLAAHEHEGPIDLVITDVIMPHMNGPQLVAGLRSRRPGVRVLYTSGDVCGAVDGLHGAEAAPVLRKPFGPLELVERTRQALGVH